MGKIKFIDLFSGIGGFRQGLTEVEGIEFECVLSCEIDKNARKTYSKLYNLNENVENWNVTELQKNYENGEPIFEYNKELFLDDAIKLASLNSDEIKTLISYSQRSKEVLDNPYQLLCAGFPCQPFSRSGKRRAFKDENRGNLFFAISEIIKNTNPEYILLENVKGLLTVGENDLVTDINSFGHGKRRVESDKGRTFFEILTILTELNYDVEWEVINSSLFLPHKRERVYIFGKKRKNQKSIFPLSSNENLKFINNSDLLLLNEKSLDKFKINKENLESVQLTNIRSNTKFEFGKNSPFKNWGRAFIEENQAYIVTSKIMHEKKMKTDYKLFDAMEDECEEVKSYNLNHLQVLKQVWSKSSKQVSTGNKMGKMNFPDKLSSNCRTLTATRTLGREIMVVAYYCIENQIKYIDKIIDIDKIYVYLKNNENDNLYRDLNQKFIQNSIGTISEIAKLPSDGIELRIIPYGEEKEVKIRYYADAVSSNKFDENRLYFRTLTPLEYWKLQGFIGNEKTMKEKYKELESEEFTFKDLVEYVGEDQLLKQAGNAVTTKVITAIGKEISGLINI